MLSWQGVTLFQAWIYDEQFAIMRVNIFIFQHLVALGVWDTNNLFNVRVACSLRLREEFVLGFSLLVLHFNFCQILQIYMLYVIANSGWLISLVPLHCWDFKLQSFHRRPYCSSLFCALAKAESLEKFTSKWVQQENTARISILFSYCFGWHDEDSFSLCFECILGLNNWSE